LGHGKRTDPLTKPNAGRFSKSCSDRLLGGPDPHRNAGGDARHHGVASDGAATP
jgi:hypothetical protein